jgi:protein-tyrosine phosphatase
MASSVRQGEPDRHVALQGALNFRDVGGLAAANGQQVRRGLLFRSDALAQLTDADLRVVDRLGLRTIVDLRTARERSRNPDRLPPSARPRCIHLPMSDRLMQGSTLRQVAWIVACGPSIDPAALLRQQYTAFAFECTESVCALLRCIADPANLPALVHCTAGKDRTGFTMAVLLLTLGVAPELVIADHLLSNRFLQPATPRFVRRLRWLSLGRLRPQQIAPLFEARADLLEHVLELIGTKHGTIQAWLEHACGVDLVTQRRLAAALLTAGG